jgi:hypothetical protein
MLNILRCGVALIVIGLFGCGGGGGGDGGAAPSGGGGGGGGGAGSPSQPPSTPVAISSTNQQKAAEVAIEPALSGLNVLGSATAVQTTSASQPRLMQVLHAATNPLRERLGSGQVVLGVVQTINCSVSGSITIDAADSGTSATTTFNACSFVAGSTMTGSITVSGISVGANNSISGSYTIDVTFVESGQPTFRIVGNFSISETCPTSSTCTTIFSGSSLGTQEGTETWFISNFSITETVTSNVTEVTASYTVSSSVLGGSVTVSTLAPIQTFTGSVYPSLGQILVTGAGSRVRVTILSSNPSNTMAVRVELDATNDGTFETTTHYSWTQLESA